jgi:hypothetical protein
MLIKEYDNMLIRKIAVMACFFCFVGVFGTDKGQNGAPNNTYVEQNSHFQRTFPALDSIMEYGDSDSESDHDNNDHENNMVSISLNTSYDSNGVVENSSKTVPKIKESKDDNNKEQHHISLSGKTSSSFDKNKKDTKESEWQKTDEEISNASERDHHTNNARLKKYYKCPRCSSWVYLLSDGYSYGKPRFYCLLDERFCYAADAYEKELHEQERHGTYIERCNPVMLRILQGTDASSVAGRKLLEHIDSAGYVSNKNRQLLLEYGITKKLGVEVGYLPNKRKTKSQGTKSQVHSHNKLNIGYFDEGLEISNNESASLSSQDEIGNSNNHKKKRSRSKSPPSHHGSNIIYDDDSDVSYHESDEDSDASVYDNESDEDSVENSAKNKYSSSSRSRILTDKPHEGCHANGYIQSNGSLSCFTCSKCSFTCFEGAREFKELFPRVVEYMAEKNNQHFSHKKIKFDDEDCSSGEEIEKENSDHDGHSHDINTWYTPGVGENTFTPNALSPDVSNVSIINGNDSVISGNISGSSQKKVEDGLCKSCRIGTLFHHVYSDNSRSDMRCSRCNNPQE